MSNGLRPDMHSPPPGQGNYPASGYSQGQQQHFDPPPRSAYEDYDYNYPRSLYEDERPYAPGDPRAHSFNQIAPYDGEKAEAGWARTWEEQQAYTHRPPPPLSDYDLGRKPRPTVSDRYYDDRYYDDDRYYKARDRESHAKRPRRRSTEDELKEKALGCPSDPKKGGRDFLGGSEGESGIAAKLIGGAGGALLGQTFGRGHTLETIAGAAVGAIAARAIEKQIEKRKEEKVYVRHSRDGYAAPSAGPCPQPGRDTKNVRDSARDGARPGMRERFRSFSSRRTRSLSRRRPSEDRRWRSDSYDSLDSYRRGSSR